MTDERARDTSPEDEGDEDTKDLPDDVKDGDAGEGEED